jgi:hypothetical protein
LDEADAAVDAFGDGVGQAELDGLAWPPHDS